MPPRALTRAARGAIERARAIGWHPERRPTCLRTAAAPRVRGSPPRARGTRARASPASWWLGSARVDVLLIVCPCERAARPGPNAATACGCDAGAAAARERADTGRLEAFRDGIMAAAITGLIVNVQVPHVGADLLWSFLAPMAARGERRGERPGDRDHPDQPPPTFPAKRRRRPRARSCCAWPTWCVTRAGSPTASPRTRSALRCAHPREAR
jgi:hypothetical protein